MRAVTPPLLPRVAAAALGCGAALLGACSTTAPLRPLGKGRTTAGASLGGPLVRIEGASLPAPVVEVGGAHGLRDDLEATARVGVSQLAFGVTHLVPGVAWHPVVRERGAVPTVTVAGALHLLTNYRAFRAAPQATVAADWALGRHHAYVGADAALVLADPTRALAGPLLGLGTRVGRVGLALEGKWLAPWRDVEATALDWRSPGGRGYLSVLFGVTYHLEALR